MNGTLKSKRIVVLVTEAQHKNLRQRAGDGDSRSISDFIRTRLFNYKPENDGVTQRLVRIEEKLDRALKSKKK